MRWTHEAACHIGKDKIAVFPFLPNLSPLPFLLDLMLFEKGNIKLWKVNEAFPSFCFRVSFHVSERIYVVYRMENNEYPPLEINISPTKGKDFPPPHAGDNGSHDYQL